MKRLSLIVCLVFLLPATARAEPVAVGLYHNPPLIDLSREAPRGLFVDILTGLAPALGWSIRFETGDFGEILERTASGDLDLMAAAALTPARTERMAFNETPLLSVWGALYQAPDTPILTLGDLDHLTIAHQPGTVFSEELERICRAMAQQCLWAEVEDPAAALRDGDVDAVLTDSARAAAWVAAGEMIPSAIAFSPFALHLAGEPERLAAFDQVLAEEGGVAEAILAQAFETWLPKPAAQPEPVEEVTPQTPPAPFEAEEIRPLSAHPAVFYSLVLIIALCLLWVSEGPKWRRRRAEQRAAAVNQAALDDLLFRAGLSEVTVARDQTITAIRPARGTFDAKTHLGWTLPGLCIDPEAGRDFLKEVRANPGPHEGWLDLRDGDGPGRTFAVQTHAPEREDAPLRLLIRDVTVEAENEDRWARDLAETEEALAQAETARVEAIREAEPDRTLVTLLRSLPGALDQSTETGREALLTTLLAHTLTMTRADRISQITVDGDTFRFGPDITRDTSERPATGEDHPLTDYPWLAERLAGTKPFRLVLSEDTAPEQALFDASDTQDAFFVPIRPDGTDVVAWAGLEMTEPDGSLSSEDLSLFRMIGAVACGLSSEGEREAEELREVG